ncbi:hypothetical protein SDC9_150277 [bioreactor metagenome]|uniref:Uncharacterized protein n=1 Tax=bioreactor metagenome TaxID=1076179 RepID=A0A645ER25_9ZZZZ
MVYPEIHRRPQVIKKVFLGLVGQGGHKINADIGKARFSGLQNGFFRLIRGMYPAQYIQFLLQKGLNPDANPRESRLFEPPEGL